MEPNNESYSYALYAGDPNMTWYVSYGREENVAKAIEIYAMPVICIFGLISNTLCAIVFMHRQMRNNSCSTFLAARSISDNGFLATLLLIWTSSVFELRLSNILGICQMLIFLTYVCGCISVWLVVFVTAENYIRICRPMMVGSYCRKENARIIIIFLVVFVVCCYNFPFWTLNKDCTASADHFAIIQVLIYVDTFLTLIIPSILITCLMVAIVSSLVQSCNRRRRLSVSMLKQNKHPLAQITKMLLATTVIFFCLNLPSHVVRLRLMIRSIISGNDDVTRLDETIQTVALLVYYMSMAGNLLVYYIFGTRFKKVFKKTFFRCFSRQEPLPVMPVPMVRQNDKLSLPNINYSGADCQLIPGHVIRRSASQ